jgi:hypothetical protein
MTAVKTRLVLWSLAILSVLGLLAVQAGPARTLASPPAAAGAGQGEATEQGVESMSLLEWVVNSVIGRSLNVPGAE